MSMTETGFGLKFKMAETGKYRDVRFDGIDLHQIKSVAGKLFLQPDVKSVCVYDCNGVARLYLKKDDDGHCVMREERNADGSMK